MSFRLFGLQVLTQCYLSTYLTELYDYCIKEGYADKNLIAKWKKQGYENLCCLRCIQTRDTNFGTNCICRVPKSKLEVVSLPEFFSGVFQSFTAKTFFFIVKA